jgi:hypothetical protein
LQLHPTITLRLFAPPIVLLVPQINGLPVGKPLSASVEDFADPFSISMLSLRDNDSDDADADFLRNGAEEEEEEKDDEEEEDEEEDEEYDDGSSDEEAEAVG